jgi:hypothetical protein
MCAPAAVLIALSLAQVEPAVNAAEPPPATVSPAASPQLPPPPRTPSPVTPAAPAARGPTLWGFIDAQFSHTDPHAPARGTSTFELRRARIGARGDVVPAVGYVVLFDGADTSLKDAYLAVKYVPGLEIRMGQWKTPFGYEQSESDTKLLWVNTSYVVAALARGSDSRDLGAGTVGKWQLAGPLSGELSASFVNGAGPNKKDDLDEKNVWGRAGVGRKLGPASLRAGGSFGAGHQVQSLGANARFDGVGTPVDDAYFYFRTYGADVTLDTPWLFAAAELIQSERDVSKHTAPTAVARSSLTARGWYAGIYGKTPWNLGPVFRAERFDPSRSDADDRSERYTIGAYLDVRPVSARLVFNYEIDASEKASTNRPGDRAIAFAQVVF